jgi:uncharacterized HAD superfamily protein
VRNSRRIYVDVDDVLAQTGRMFLGILAREFGRKVAFEEIRSYHLGDSFRLAADELDEFMRLAHQPEALRSVEPMPGAAEALAEWKRNGHQVFVVTGRPPATRDDTLGWLQRHDMAYTEFHFLDKYSEFYSGQHGTPEGVLCLADLPALDFSLAVEDFPGAAEHLARTVGVPVALFDRPWNRGVEEIDDPGAAPLVRCRGWAEIRRRFPASSNRRAL